MAEPIVLVNKAHVTLMDMQYEDEVLAYACPKCGLVFGATEREKKLAAKHCEQRRCSRCGAEIHGKVAYLLCDLCRVEERKRKVAERAAAARRVSYDEWDGPVCVEDECGDPVNSREGYFGDIGDALEYIDEEYRGQKVYAWGTAPAPFQLNAEDLVDSLTGEIDDHGCVPSSAIAELQELLDTWCTENDPGAYEVDYGVLLVEDGGAAE